MRLAPCLALTLLLGCTRAKPPVDPAAGGTPGGKVASDEAKAKKSAGTFAEPITRCGPRDSYAYVAREFRCTDGSNPFKGELQAAAQSRLGSRSHPNGHIVDAYKVPCAGGDETVYVDMYGCAEAQEMLENKPSPQFKAAAEAFDQGDFAQAVRTCLEIIEGDKVDQNVVRCLTMAPAAMALSGGERHAMRLTEGFCSKMTNPNNGEKVRRDHVGEIARWLARGARGRLSREDFEALVARFAGVCGLIREGQGA